MFRPAFYALARLQARAALRRQGHGFFRISEIMEAAEDDLIDVAAEEAGVTAEQAGAVTVALGDGKIIDAILGFFRSEQGQALIAALIKLLLGFIG